MLFLHLLQGVMPQMGHPSLLICSGETDLNSLRFERVDEFLGLVFPNVVVEEMNELMARLDWIPAGLAHPSQFVSPKGSEIPFIWFQVLKSVCPSKLEGLVHQ